jgi:hypothetical protein
MSNLKTTISTVVVVGALAGVAGSASAATAWQLNRPHRTEVNARLAYQNRRIHEEVHEGDLSRAEAARFHLENRQIRREERLVASVNGGHITKLEQRALNAQLNGVSAQIGR